MGEVRQLRGGTTEQPRRRARDDVLFLSRLQGGGRILPGEWRRPCLARGPAAPLAAAVRRLCQPDLSGVRPDLGIFRRPPERLTVRPPRATSVPAQTGRS